jgi:TetR/AcrR family transcriptional regulator of autoinduction and epiphytic fitness
MTPTNEGQAATTTPSAPTGDGRTLRTERSRRAAVEAVLDLLDEGEPQPTARLVAERSGVSSSTIFRLYDDLDALHAAAIAVQTERVAPLLTRFPLDAPLPERIDLLVENRATIYEYIGRVRRFAKHLARSSARVDTHLRRFDDFLRSQALELFDVELSGRDDAATRRELVDAVTSWDTWDRLRDAQGLTPARAKVVVRAALVDNLS